ncbi:MAG: VTT domain-containing protein [Burkholderiales bacterium]
MAKKHKPAWAKLGLILLAAAALAALWRYTPLAEFASRQKIMEWARIARTTRWAPFAVAAAYVPAAFIMFPRPLLSLLAIIAFGIGVGGATVAAGVLAAALAAYYVGHLIPPQTVRRLAGSSFERLSALLKEHAILAIFAANMLPTPPFAVQGMMAGAIRLKLWKYTAGTLLSLMPGLVALLVFGHQINTALEDPSKVSYVAIAGALVGFALVVFLATRWMSRQS